MLQCETSEIEGACQVDRECELPQIERMWVIIAVDNLVFAPLQMRKSRTCQCNVITYLGSCTDASAVDDAA